MNSENPYLPPRTQSEQAISEVRAASNWPRRFLFLQLLVVTLGFLAAYFINIQAIIVTGLVLVLVGLLLSVFSWRDKDLCSLACGVSGVAFSVFIFGLIYHNAWSPSEARRPVLILACVYVIGFLLWAGWTIYRRRGDAVQNAS
ncbi:MAG: hypothetical protein GY924_28005 [Planctomycetaceae bacterium]|nr:hypothetical protein [Planctomycetaceae bacterium]